MLDLGLFLMVVGVLLATPILWVVGLVLVAFGVLRWVADSARYLVSRPDAPRSLTTVSR